MDAALEPSFWELLLGAVLFGFGVVVVVLAFIAVLGFLGLLDGQDE